MKSYSRIFIVFLIFIINSFSYYVNIIYYKIIVHYLAVFGKSSKSLSHRIKVIYVVLKTCSYISGYPNYNSGKHKTNMGNVTLITLSNLHSQCNLSITIENFPPHPRHLKSSKPGKQYDHYKLQRCESRQTRTQHIND